MVSRSSAKISSALGPRDFENLSVKLFRRPLPSFLKIGVSPPFGPNETIFCFFAPFLLKPIGPNFFKSTFGNLFHREKRSPI